MKNLNVLLNAILLIAVVVLFYKQYSTPNKVEEKKVNPKELKANTAKVVYINTDSLLSQYNLSVDLSEKIMKEHEDSKTKFNIKAKAFQRDLIDFKKKIENNGFLTRERAEKRQKELQKKEIKLKELDRELSQKLAKEQQKINKRLYDTLTNFLKEYSTQRGYDVVLTTTKGGNVIYSKDRYEITEEVVKILNSRYKK